MNYSAHWNRNPYNQSNTKIQHWSIWTRPNLISYPIHRTAGSYISTERQHFMLRMIIYLIYPVFSSLFLWHKHKYKQAITSTYTYGMWLLIHILISAVIYQNTIESMTWMNVGVTDSLGFGLSLKTMVSAMCIANVLLSSFYILHSFTHVITYSCHHLRKSMLVQANRVSSCLISHVLKTVHIFVSWVLQVAFTGYLPHDTSLNVNREHIFWRVLWAPPYTTNGVRN